jgi:hypothetical protein
MSPRLGLPILAHKSVRHQCFWTYRTAPAQRVFISIVIGRMLVVGGSWRSLEEYEVSFGSVLVEVREGLGMSGTGLGAP